ncbi:hypothetical protein [Maritalea sp.]|uniref:hypothetical protein n=1 Tax=Maritalea sp. TaxID=2003361 RepID=UPI003EFAE2CF
MLGRRLKTVMNMIKLTRAERALTLGIFLLFQAMLPSYAGVLSTWSDDDLLVICSAHGLIEIANPNQPQKINGDGTMCIVAQSAAADLGFGADLPTINLPLLGAMPLVPMQLQDYRRGVSYTPQSPRAPPLISSQI